MLRIPFATFEAQYVLISYSTTAHTAVAGLFLKFDARLKVEHSFQLVVSEWNFIVFVRANLRLLIALICIRSETSRVSKNLRFREGFCILSNNKSS